MKTKENSKAKLVKVPKSVLLSLVAAKLKDRDLLPEKNDEDKEYLKKARVW